MDDEPDVGEVLQFDLEREHIAEVVTSGQEALEKLTAGERYDVILCDLLMPAMSGIELHAAVVSLAPDQAERIIFMTAGAFIPRAREFLERVPNPHIDKPFNLAKLHALIADRVR